MKGKKTTDSNLRFHWLTKSVNIKVNLEVEKSEQVKSAFVNDVTHKHTRNKNYPSESSLWQNVRNLYSLAIDFCVCVCAKRWMKRISIALRLQKFGWGKRREFIIISSVSVENLLYSVDKKLLTNERYVISTKKKRNRAKKNPKKSCCGLSILVRRQVNWALCMWRVPKFIRSFHILNKYRM